MLGPPKAPVFVPSPLVGSAEPRVCDIPADDIVSDVRAKQVNNGRTRNLKVEQKVNFKSKESSKRADVLGGHITPSWFRSEPKDKVDGRQWIQRQKWPHEAEI